MSNDPAADALQAVYAQPSTAPAVTPNPTAPAAPNPQPGPGPRALNAAKSAGKSAIAPLFPVLTGAARAVGTTVSPVFDVLNRAHEATTAGLGSGSFGTAVQTLIHGQSPESQDATRVQIRTQMGLDGSEPSPLFRLTGLKPLPKGSRYQDLPHWQQGLVDFMVDTETDPLTYAGGTGALEHLAALTGLKVGPELLRLLSVAEKSSNPAVSRAAKIAGGIYDVTHFKGSTQRALAGASGAEGMNQFRGLKAINNSMRGKKKDLAQSLIGQFRDVVKGLSEDDEMALYQAVHTGTVAALPPNLEMRAAAFKRVTDSLAHLSGDDEVRRMLAEGFEVPGAAVRGRAPLPGEVAPPSRSGGGFELPETLQRFEPEGGARNLQEANQYREHYVPTAHDARSFIAREEGRGGIAFLDPNTLRPTTDESLSEILHSPGEPPVNTRTTKGVDAADPSLRERGDEAHLLPPELQRKVIEARLRGGASAIAARDAEREVATLFGVKNFQSVPRDAQEFFRETYTRPEDRQWWQHLANGWKGAIDIPKAGLFALPFRHMANIATLSFLADPSLANVFGSAGKFARLMLASADPEARARILGEAGKFGVTGTPSIDREAAGWLGRIPGVGEIYKASNHVLWTFDDAVKATRFNGLIAKYSSEGMDRTRAAYRAADDVGAEMIDYSNRSPLTQALSYIAPFASYRTKFPLAIARVTARHPERVLAAGRASPELVGDVQQGPPDANGNPQVGKSFLPLADTFRGIENPWAFARSTLGYPAQMALSQAGVHADDYPNYFTYGKPVDAKYLANATVGSFPGGASFLAAIGQGEFVNQGDIGGAIRGQTGFGLSRAPSFKNIAAAAHVQALQDAIAEAHKRGDTASVTAYEAQLRTYLRYNHLYEK